MIWGMSAKVIPLFTAPPRQYLEIKIRELAKDSKNIVFDHPHVQDRIVGRKLSMRHVLECIRTGDIVHGPSMDEGEDYRVKLCRYVAGRRVQVVLAVKDNRMVVVTVI